MQHARRPVWALVVGVLVLAPGASDGAAQHCDPTTTSSPAPIPSRLARHCGNGRIDSYATGCERLCGVGCGIAPQCAVSCDERQELCDGSTLTTTCAELGFGGGTLGCVSRCTAYDTSRCEPCTPSARVHCGAMPLTGLVDVEALVIAPRDTDIGVVFLAHRGTRAPADGWTEPATLFVAILDAELHVRAGPREITRTDWGATIVGTSDGYLVATTGGTDSVVWLVSATTGVGRRVPHADTTGRVLDLELASSGDALMLSSAGDAFPVALLGSRGEPVPFPSGPVLAHGRDGRVVVLPLGDGSLALPQRFHAGALAPAGGIETHVGDRLVAFAGSQFGAQHEVEVEIVRDGARIDGYRADRGSGAAPGPLPELDIMAPGGLRVTLTASASGFDDRVTDASGAVLVHASGSSEAPPDVPVFGGRGVEVLRFVTGPRAIVGLALHQTRLEDGIDPSRTGARLVVARITP